MKAAVYIGEEKNYVVSSDADLIRIYTARSFKLNLLDVTYI